MCINSCIGKIVACGAATCLYMFKSLTHTANLLRVLLQCHVNCHMVSSAELPTDTGNLLACHDYDTSDGTSEFDFSSQFSSSFSSSSTCSSQVVIRDPVAHFDYFSDRDIEPAAHFRTPTETVDRRVYFNRFGIG